MRERYIDTVAGIMILVMVLGHYTTLSGSTIDLHLEYLGFFMPWFFYKSGLFFKEKRIKDSLIADAKKLLWPFITFTFLGWILNCVHLYLRNDYNIVHYILTPPKELLLGATTAGNEPLWFLVTLFIVKNICNVASVYKIPSNFVLLISFLLSVSLFYSKLNMPDYIANSCTGLYFYVIGREMKVLNNAGGLISNGIVILAYVCILFFAMPLVDMRVNSLVQGNYLLWFVYAPCACYAINLLVKHIHYSFPILSWIGKNSMVLYVTHWLIFLIISIILLGLGVEVKPNTYFILLFSAFVIFEPLLVYCTKNNHLQRLLYI